ncbi:DUF7127 family protein [Natronorubrum sp. FCH18a]|uniref:DUF7127 family protein n=1 Tax=Natronorubrum sp. FCH18a TaxID=3447018 RepID=UPI003F50FA7B
METPPELETAAGDREEITITKREYDGEQVIAVDFGPTGDTPSLDVVDGTAIVVVDGTQLEFDVPADATDVTVNDGILTIRG